MPSPSLAQLIDFAGRLRTDEETPLAELRARDQPLHDELAPLRRSPEKQLAAWLDALPRPEGGAAGRSIERVYGLGTGLVGLLGLLTGIGAGAAVFYYDGSQPVNVIAVLAVLVFLPLLLLLLSGVLILPGALRVIPGVRGLQEILTAVHPGRLAWSAVRLVPSAQRRLVEDAVATGRVHGRLFGGVERWALIRASQWGAVLFHVGALACSLVLIAFSDLAFSWSTTLQVEPSQLHQWTSTMAAPWAAVLPDAVPSLPLVEATRYFRAETLAPDDPAALGEWWLFLVCAMVLYGLVPRALALALAHGRLAAAIRRSFTTLPGARDVLQRINQPAIDMRSPAPATDTPSTGETISDLTPMDAHAVFALINWSQAIPPAVDAATWSTDAWGATPGPILEAGGARTPDEDAALIASLGAGRDAIRIAVKAWEPPLAECVDFLEAVRRAVGPDRPLVVIPLGRAADGRPAAAARAAVATWHRRVHRMADPHTTVRAWPGAAAS